jgi:hypothetical protein
MAIIKNMAHKIVQIIFFVDLFFLATSFLTFSAFISSSASNKAL